MYRIGDQFSVEKRPLMRPISRSICSFSCWYSLTSFREGTATCSSVTLSRCSGCFSSNFSKARILFNKSCSPVCSLLQCASLNAGNGLQTLLVMFMLHTISIGIHQGTTKWPNVTHVHNYSILVQIDQIWLSDTMSHVLAADLICPNNKYMQIHWKGHALISVFHH